jgi:hypothetical protein
MGGGVEEARGREMVNSSREGWEVLLSKEFERFWMGTGGGGICEGGARASDVEIRAGRDGPTGEETSTSIAISKLPLTSIDSEDCLSKRTAGVPNSGKLRWPTIGALPCRCSFSTFPERSREILDVVEECLPSLLCSLDGACLATFFRERMFCRVFSSAFSRTPSIYEYKSAGVPLKKGMTVEDSWSDTAVGWRASSTFGPDFLDVEASYLETDPDETVVEELACREPQGG